MGEGLAGASETKLQAQFELARIEGAEPVRAVRRASGRLAQLGVRWIPGSRRSHIDPAQIAVVRPTGGDAAAEFGVVECVRGVRGEFQRHTLPDAKASRQAQIQVAAARRANA